MVVDLLNARGVLCETLHRSLAQLFQEEIASPLGLDFYFRVPEKIPNSRLAPSESLTALEMLLSFPIQLTLATLYPRSSMYRALMANPGAAIRNDEERDYSRNLEVPSGGGVGTARAIARAYSAFATGGQEPRLLPETLQLLMAPAIPAERGFYDECMKVEIQFSLGFCKPGPTSPFGHPGSFGRPGAVGSRRFRRFTS
jgi:hypothetical protein